jgi:tryptophan synthase beta chain
MGQHPMTTSPATAPRPGYFGRFGGRFVSETLVLALDALDRNMREIVPSAAFQAELQALLKDYVGRPTPLTQAERLAREIDPSGTSLRSLWLKREDLCHTGAHKINNAIGQVLLAKHTGKTRIIAETGAGQHGVATATASALFGLPCDVYMGAVDVERQAPNVARMQLLGARVIPVESGSRTLKDAMNEALRDWVTNVEGTHYCIGSAAGPHPYPELVARLQSVIGVETRAALAERGIAPDGIIACVGGGSNAIGIFRPFIEDASVALYGVEAAGDGVDTPRHAATLSKGREGILHGSKSYVLCDDQGQITEAHSISAGLDYPGVGPEHAHLRDTGRAQYLAVTDTEALAALSLVAKSTGILIALETAHAFAAIAQIAKQLAGERRRPVQLVVCTSGRGDKDLRTVVDALLPDTLFPDTKEPHAAH